jgi:predicted TIM-barrel fold metal-dependent hydrolase
VKRRDLLAAASGGAAAAIFPGVLSHAAGKPAASNHAGAIDVHHHIFPPFFVERWLASSSAANEFVLPAARDWTPDKSLAQLDPCEVRTAIVTHSPRAFFHEMAADDIRALVRRSNEYAARLGQDYPGRFAQFAFLPMPDVDGSVREIAYARDVLKTVGIGMMTSYGDKWLGDPAFAPVLEELNRGKSVTFVHPTTAACCGNLMPYVPSVESGLIEYPYDTGRAIMSLLLSGSLVRYPDIRWIFCHAGGVIPMLAGRIRTLAPGTIKNLAEIAPQGTDHEFRRLYYDTANSAYSPTMAALLGYAPLNHVLFGTDYPYVSVGDNATALSALNLAPTTLRAIQRENALRLMPDLPA